eukprot:m.408915 g.408915  ORF g.408915 m.408915 type:complete len:210 (-) comp56510_c0_seq45:1417-2046(-)
MDNVPSALVPMSPSILIQPLSNISTGTRAPPTHSTARQERQYPVGPNRTYAQKEHIQPRKPDTEESREEIAALEAFAADQAVSSSLLVGDFQRVQYLIFGPLNRPLPFAFSLPNRHRARRCHLRRRIQKLSALLQLLAPFGSARRAPQRPAARPTIPSLRYQPWLLRACRLKLSPEISHPHSKRQMSCPLSPPNALQTLLRSLRWQTPL